tara:strand:+ start:1016 stop:1222 length:207 start_codon:yes stop_codon:yes gene_type:complete
MLRRSVSFAAPSARSPLGPSKSSRKSLPTSALSRPGVTIPTLHAVAADKSEDLDALDAIDESDATARV